MGLTSRPQFGKARALRRGGFVAPAPMCSGLGLGPFPTAVRPKPAGALHGPGSVRIGYPRDVEGEGDVAKPEWGMKRTCTSCGAKYYDLEHDPIVCPACGATYDFESATKLKRSQRLPDVEKVKVEKAEKVVDDEDEVAIDDDSDDGDVLEDTSDLEEDDVAVVGGPGEDDEV